MAQNPLAPPPPSGNGPQDKWLWLLWRRLTQAGQILWNSLDFTGSNLTDLATRNHNDLQSLQGGTTNEYYHMTAAEDSLLSKLSWNATEGTVDIAMGYDSVVQQVGLETYYHVKNQTAGTLLDGRAARQVGTVGNSGQLLVDYAIADNSHSDKVVLGLLTMDILTGEDGFVTDFGLVRGINTTGTPYGETWADGDALYVSAVTAGYLTKTAPVAPLQRLLIGYVVHAHANGSIFVHQNHGQLLEDCHDVSSATPADRDSLIWNNSTGVWEPDQLEGTDVHLPKLQTPTRHDVTEFFNTYPSGVIDGGIISATGTQIEVTAGEGLIKSGATINDPTYFCEWSALALTTLTDARVTWVCVDYNAGNPTLLLLEETTSSEPAAMNYNSCWPLGYCVREGSTVHVTNNPRKVQDAVGGLIRRFHQTLPLARDELVGGLNLAETGTRNITISAGYLFDRQNRFSIRAIDTSVAGNFDRYYQAVSGFTSEMSQTQWPNTQYDNGSGTLVTMTNNRYANLFWYLELDGNLIMLYGRNEYTTAAAASLESVPATVPLRVSVDGKLIARTTFQKSAATFTSIDTVFSTTFSASAATTHNNLSGIQGGAAGDYYHLTGAQATDLTDGGETNLHTHPASDITVGAGKTLTATAGTVLLPAVASPAQTADGSIVWDSDDNLLTVGDGSSRKVMADTASPQTLTNKTMAAATNVIEARSGPDTSAFTFRNKIINGGMDVWQRGTTFDATTSVLNSDDTYLADRWYLLSDGNDIVDVTRQADATTGGLYSFRMDVETANKKFGIAQIVEYANSAPLIGGTATLTFKAKITGTSLTNIKAGVVAWSGTADTVTSDIVSAWGADGVTPTLIANATFENTPVDLDVTTSWATYTTSNISIDTASAKNLIVFIWCDNATTTIGDFLYVTQAQLEYGSVATPFETRPYGVELALCQRYYRELCTPGINAQYVLGAGKMVSTTIGTFPIQLPIQMRTTPTRSISSVSDFIIYAGTGTSTISGFSLSAQSDKQVVSFGVTASSGLTDGTAVLVYTFNTSARLSLEAEL